MGEVREVVKVVVVERGKIMSQFLHVTTTRDQGLSPLAALTNSESFTVLKQFH